VGSITTTTPPPTFSLTLRAQCREQRAMMGAQIDFDIARLVVFNIAVLLLVVVKVPPENFQERARMIHTVKRRFPA
jgi:hypothetical protein